MKDLKIRLSMQGKKHNCQIQKNMEIKEHHEEDQA